MGCIVLSLSVFAAEPEGGLEQIIDHMEKNGLTHDMQLDAPDDQEETEAAPDAADTDAAVSAQPNPVTGALVTPAERRKSSAVTSSGGTVVTHDTDGKVVSITRKSPKTQNTAATNPTPSTWQRIKRVATRQTVTFPSHNPLADQAPATGGLEQIFDTMQMNASSPMRVGQAPDYPTTGAERDQNLRERLAD